MKPTYEETIKRAKTNADCGEHLSPAEVTELVLAFEAQVKQLAAENAALKDLAKGWANATDDRLFEEHGEIFNDSIDACEEELKSICPNTDAVLASLRAEGVEMALTGLLSYLNHDVDIDSMQTKWEVSSAVVEYINSQLRSQSEQVKGVQS